MKREAMGDDRPLLFGLADAFLSSSRKSLSSPLSPSSSSSSSYFPSILLLPQQESTLIYQKPQQIQQTLFDQQQQQQHQQTIQPQNLFQWQPDQNYIISSQQQDTSLYTIPLDNYFLTTNNSLETQINKNLLNSTNTNSELNQEQLNRQLILPSNDSSFFCLKEPSQGEVAGESKLSNSFYRLSNQNPFKRKKVENISSEKIQTDIKSIKHQFSQQPQIIKFQPQFSQLQPRLQQLQQPLQKEPQILFSQQQQQQLFQNPQLLQITFLTQTQPSSHPPFSPSLFQPISQNSYLSPSQHLDQQLQQIQPPLRSPHPLPNYITSNPPSLILPSLLIQSSLLSQNNQNIFSNYEKKTKSFPFLETSQLFSLGPQRLSQVARDHQGSRLIQETIDKISSVDFEILFNQLFPQLTFLSSDVFGNYVVQKLLSKSNKEQLIRVIQVLKSQISSFSKNTFACRVVQKAIQLLNDEGIKKSIIKVVHPLFLELSTHQNANHVVQKLIQSALTPSLHCLFMLIKGKVASLSCDVFACRIIQRCLEKIFNKNQSFNFNQNNPCIDLIDFNDYHPNESANEEKSINENKFNNYKDEKNNEKYVISQTKVNKLFDDEREEFRETKEEKPEASLTKNNLLESFGRQLVTTTSTNLIHKEDEKKKKKENISFNESFYFSNEYTLTATYTTNKNTTITTFPTKSTTRINTTSPRDREKHYFQNKSLKSTKNQTLLLLETCHKDKETTSASPPPPMLHLNNLTTTNKCINYDFFIREIIEKIDYLITDQYGNYVVQYMMENGGEEEKKEVIGKLRGKFVQLSQHKHASNVLEKCLLHSAPQEKKLIIQELLQQENEEDGTEEEKSEKTNLILEDKEKEEEKKIFEIEEKKKIIRFITNSQNSFYENANTNLFNNENNNFIFNKTIKNINKQIINKNKISHDTSLNNGNLEKKEEVQATNKQKGEKDKKMEKIKFIQAEMPIVKMLKDKYGNYVLQRVLEVAEKEQKEEVVRQVERNLHLVKDLTFAKFIVNKINMNKKVM